MSNIRKALMSLASVALLFGATACSDSPLTGPTADLGTPAFAKAPKVDNTSRIVSTKQIGDTTVTVFIVGTATTSAATFQLGNKSSIVFAGSASSICNVATSSYGEGTWDSKCSASTTPVQITAKTWRKADGTVESDFQPAMRFVPTATKAVFLSLWDGTSGNGVLKKPRIDFRASNGAVINEASADLSLFSIYTVTKTTVQSPTTSSLSSLTLLETDAAPGGYDLAGVVSRRIKHFSGYTVTAD